MEKRDGGERRRKRLKRKTVLIWGNATNTAAHRFYQRLGFRFVERRQFGEDDTFVFRLERADFRG